MQSTQFLKGERVLSRPSKARDAYRGVAVAMPVIAAGPPPAWPRRVAVPENIPTRNGPKVRYQSTSSYPLKLLVCPINAQSHPPFSHFFSLPLLSRNSPSWDPLAPSAPKPLTLSKKTQIVSKLLLLLQEATLNSLQNKLPNSSPSSSQFATQKISLN